MGASELPHGSSPARECFRRDRSSQDKSSQVKSSKSSQVKSSPLWGTRFPPAQFSGPHTLGHTCTNMYKSPLLMSHITNSHVTSFLCTR